MTKLTTKFAAIALAVVTVTGATVASTEKAEAGRAGAAIAAGIIGLAAGAIIAGSAARAHHRPVRVRRVCRVRPVYNRWGDYLGKRRVCRRVHVY